MDDTIIKNQNPNLWISDTGEYIYVTNDLSGIIKKNRFRVYYLKYSNTIIVISISSMSCFILNMFSFYFLTKWNNEDEKIRDKLMIEPVVNIDFTRLYSCFNCYERKNTQKEIHERENMSKNDMIILISSSRHSRGGFKYAIHKILIFNLLNYKTDT